MKCELAPLAPRFKAVTASLGHSLVPPTWKLIRSVHMIHEKRAFVLRDKSSFLSEACLTAREAALRAGKVLRREISAEVCGTLPFPSCEARSFTAALPPLRFAPRANLHGSSAAPSHRATRDPSCCLPHGTGSYSCSRRSGLSKIMLPCRSCIWPFPASRARVYMAYAMEMSV